MKYIKTGQSETFEQCWWIDTKECKVAKLIKTILHKSLQIIHLNLSINQLLDLVYFDVTQANPHLRLVNMYFMALVHCSSLLNWIFTEKEFPVAGSYRQGYMFYRENLRFLKRTVHEVSCDPPLQEWPVRFTKLTLNPLSDKIWIRNTKLSSTLLIILGVQCLLQRQSLSYLI